MISDNPGLEPQSSIFDRIAADYDHLDTLVRGVVDYWPAHRSFVERSLLSHSADNLVVLDGMAEQIIALTAQDPERFYSRYKWMCNEFNKEALHFLRSGQYKCKTFEEAKRDVYDNKEFMTNYMDGLLISQLFWFNHARSYIYYSKIFSKNFNDGGDYLEIGPGHGLFLAQAASDKRLGEVTAWDVSEESLRLTGEALEALGVKRDVKLRCRDVMTAGGEDRYNFIVISEVLEHLEQPREALVALREHLLPGGKMLINFPINSPAPDHIYFLKSPDEVAELIHSAGYEILDESTEPMTGYDVAEAIERRGTVTCLYTVTADR